MEYVGYAIYAGFMLFMLLAALYPIWKDGDQ